MFTSQGIKKNDDIFWSLERREVFERYPMHCVVIYAPLALRNDDISPGNHNPVPPLCVENWPLPYILIGVTHVIKLMFGAN